MIRPSSTLAVTLKARELKAAGVDVLSFAAGEPDFDTPARIKQAAIRALEEGKTGYAAVPGELAARAAIAAKLSKENGLPNVTPNHVVVSAGGKQSLYLIFQSLLDPAGAGGEKPWDVLLPTPAWVSYAPQAELAGGRIVEIPTDARGDFKMTPRMLEEAITARSRVLVLNSPSNPCGTMYTPDELRALGRVVQKAAEGVAPDLVVVSDEIYEKIIFGGIPHFSIGSMPEIAERVITVIGLSKAYAMTGWRIGYAAGSGAFGLKVAGAMATLQSQMTTSVTSFCHPAIAVALNECAEDVERMRAAFERRGRLIHDLMSRIPGFVSPRPTGAFYVFPDVSAHFGKSGGKRAKGERPLRTAAEFAGALLEEAHVAAVPGEDFLGCGVRCLRFSFACSEAQIEEGMKRVGEFVGGLR